MGVSDIMEEVMEAELLEDTGEIEALEFHLENYQEFEGIIGAIYDSYKGNIHEI